MIKDSFREFKRYSMGIWRVGLQNMLRAKKDYYYHLKRNSWISSDDLVGWRWFVIFINEVIESSSNWDRLFALNIKRNILIFDINKRIHHIMILFIKIDANLLINLHLNGSYCIVDTTYFDWLHIFHWKNCFDDNLLFELKLKKEETNRC